jgi:hypothetical protein
METGTYVSVWLGRGDGSLDGPLDTRLDNAGAAVAGDFNGDGILDLAVPHLAGRVSILLGVGDGSFHSPLTHDVSPDAKPLFLAVADFNLDGIHDLAIANWEFGYYENTPVSILLGNGDGTFQSPRNFEAHRGRQFFAIADFNFDGLADIVVHNSYSYDLSMLLNSGEW